MNGTITEAVILMGHGSRIQGAEEDMEHIEQRMIERLPGIRIEACTISELARTIRKNSENARLPG